MIGWSKKREARVREKAFKQKTMKPKLKLAPGLALIGLPTAGPGNPTHLYPQFFYFYQQSQTRIDKRCFNMRQHCLRLFKVFFGLPKLRQKVSEFGQCPRLYLQRQNGETSSIMKLQGYVVCSH